MLKTTEFFVGFAL